MRLPPAPPRSANLTPVRWAVGWSKPWERWKRSSGLPFAAPEPCEPPDASGNVFIAPGDWGSETPPAPPGPPVKPATPPSPQPGPEPPETRAPTTSFAKHPAATVRTNSRSAKLVIRLSSDQADATFLCKIDRSAFAFCGPKLVRRFAIGRHVVKVKARGSTGLVDQTPVVFSFRVRLPVLDPGVAQTLFCREGRVSLSLPGIFAFKHPSLANSPSTKIRDAGRERGTPVPRSDSGWTYAV